jgi:hypothetical protein
MTFLEYLEQAHPEFLVEKIAPKHRPSFRVHKTPLPKQHKSSQDYASFKRPKPKKPKKSKAKHPPSRIDAGSTHREFGK